MEQIYKRIMELPLGAYMQVDGIGDIHKHLTGITINEKIFIRYEDLLESLMAYRELETETNE